MCDFTSKLPRESTCQDCFKQFFVLDTKWILIMWVHLPFCNKSLGGWLRVIIAQVARSFYSVNSSRGADTHCGVTSLHNYAKNNCWLSTRLGFLCLDFRRKYTEFFFTYSKSSFKSFLVTHGFKNTSLTYTYVLQITIGSWKYCFIFDLEKISTLCSRNLYMKKTNIYLDLDDYPID